MPKFSFSKDPAIKKIINKIVTLLFPHIKSENIFCFRSQNSKSRAIARIYSLPRIWQSALNIEPHYIIEVISEKFDKLSDEEKEKVLIHELMHIPKTFSGSLKPHRCFGKRIDKRSVEKMYEKYLKSQSSKSQLKNQK